MRTQGGIIDKSAADFVDAVKEKGATLVGGAPVTEEWSSKIGADGYAEDAIDAVALAKKLVGVR
jgi:5-methyltetrahydrofolate--homocysteine methyltransferase